MLRRSHASPTLLSLLALAAGIALGLLGHSTGISWLQSLGTSIKPIGDLWLAALQMIVLPLVLAHTFASVAGAAGRESIGALGGRALALFVAMLAAASLVTVTVAPGLIALYRIDPADAATLQATISVPEAARQAASARLDAPAEWLTGLVPSNLFEAALRGEILPLLLFTVILAIAVRQLPDEQRHSVAGVAQGLAAAMFTVAHWVLLFAPAGVFILSFVIALGTGINAAGMMGALVITQCTVLVVCTALLYPLSSFVGRVSFRDFARAVAPAQLVAVSTRSSVASLPALVDGGREMLRLPPSATAFVLPLTVSVFKLNRPVSSVTKVLLLAHVYGIPVTAGTLASFVTTVIILSFTTLGVPGGGVAFKTMPAYLAAGIPIEGVVIAEAVEAVPDIFKTLLNVTGNMSAATILSRSSRAAHAADALAEPSPTATGA